MSAFFLRGSTLFVVLVILVNLPGVALSAPERRLFSTPNAYLVVEVLDDDLIHFELSAIGSGPSLSERLYTSPMVHKTNYDGPATFVQSANQIETADLRVIVDTSDLCVEVQDKNHGNAQLTRLCPDLDQAFKGLDIELGAITQVYGLGQQFKTLGRADGDWIQHGIREGQEGLGNGFQSFQSASVGNIQIPVYYALGNNNINYALFMDNVYNQKWEFNVSPWRARMFGDQIRWYIMSGPDLPDLRADFMELVGMPPVPPRKTFGLWVSEFGYDNFGQIDTLLTGLRDNDFPVDGFAIDLNWFGGVVPNDPNKSTMGRLDWDEDQTTPSILNANPYSFQNPASEIQKYHNDNIDLIVIEESYLADHNVDTFQQMPADFNAYARTGDICDVNNQVPVLISATDFFGVARMIDWSDSQARTWIHDNRRFPNLTQKGVTAHWTDLGEPERKDTRACYQGVETTVSGLKNEHPDIHNLYNLLWVKGIWEGYQAHQGQSNALGITNPRPFVLTRSGAAGLQRYAQLCGRATLQVISSRSRPPIMPKCTCRSRASITTAQMLGGSGARFCPTTTSRAPIAASKKRHTHSGWPTPPGQTSRFARIPTTNLFRCLLPMPRHRIWWGRRPVISPTCASATS